MPIKDLSTYPHGLKPNHALNLLLSSKPSMKPTQQSVINKNAINANINWLTDQIKSLKKKQQSNQKQLQLKLAMAIKRYHRFNCIRRFKISMFSFKLFELL